MAWTEFPDGRLKRIHVNQHVVRRNKKEGLDAPAIIVKVGGQSHMGRWVQIEGPCLVVQDPEGPLRGCGASIWVETKNLVRVRS